MRDSASRSSAGMLIQYPITYHCLVVLRSDAHLEGLRHRMHGMGISYS